MQKAPEALLFDEHDIDSMFNPRAVSEGWALLESESVHVANLFEGGVVVGEVRAPGGKKSFAVGPEQVRQYHDLAFIPCTCSKGCGCKHVVAVLLALLHTDSPGLAVEGNFRKSSPNGYPEIEVAAPPRHGKSEFAVWLDVAHSVAKSAPKPAEVAERAQCILYLLDHIRGELRIAPVSARKLKHGGFSPQREVGWEELAIGKLQAIQSVDRMIGAFADGSKSRWEELPASPEHLDRLLQLVVSSGRAYWGDVTTRALTAGPAVEGELYWYQNDDGDQWLLFRRADGKPSIVSPTNPPWYFEESTWTCGRLEVNLSGDAVKWVLQSPILHPEDAKEMHARISSSPALSWIPLPNSDFQVVTAAADVTPVLRLAAAPALAKGAVRGGDVYGYLSFRYGDRVISDLAEPTNVVKFDGGRCEILRRDVPREKKFLSDAMRCGLMQVIGRGGKAGEITLSLRSPTDAQWWSFVQNELPGLEKNGWDLRIEDSFPYTLIEIADEDWDVELERKSDWWFEINLGIEVDGQRVPLLPIISSALNDPLLLQKTKASRDNAFYVRLPDGRLATLSHERVQSLIDGLFELFDAKKFDKNGGAEISLAVALQYSELEALASIQQSAKSLKIADGLRSLKEEFEQVQKAVVPAELKAELRPYQLDGLSWLQFLRKRQFGGILADDMGLGKTVQAIAHLVTEKIQHGASKPSLVVCPTSVAPNWRSELARFAPTLKLVYFHGADRVDLLPEIFQADVVITTFPLVQRDGDVLRNIEWHTVIVDEAQNVKHHDTIAAQFLRTFRCHHKICLTGTPVENHLGELWSQMDLVLPGYLGGEKSFRRLYRTPIEKKGDQRRAQQLAARIKPFVLRRTKDLVAPELPLKTEMVREVELSGTQLDLYETMRVAMHEKVRAEIAKKGLAKSHIVVLEALLKLRQICCDPRLVAASRSVATNSRRGAALVRPPELTEAGPVKSSAKLSYLLELLPALIEDGRRILLFSQFTSMLDLIKEELAVADIPFVEITGGTKDRATPVKKFQSGKVPLFLLSLKAGGTGLNLTAADTVIHYDPWWNPAVLDQANDRAHRIGQDKPVFVYHLISTGTIEAKMLEYQERKKKLAALVHDAAQDSPFALTEADIESLLEPIR